MIITQCSVCKLDQQRLRLINNALRDPSISLSELALLSSISKSSLHRHSQHLDHKTSSTAIDNIVDDAIGLPKDDAMGLTKQEILSRAEELWQESREGLAVSKEPIVLKKADGATVELRAGDLKARAAFIRTGLQTLEAGADWSGYPRQIVSGERGGGFVQIVLPPSSGKRIDRKDISGKLADLPYR